jgi:Lrp/AsnC family transcriptional regulator
MDKSDKAILNLLQSDASLSVGEVANRVGVSKSACWRRIQKMESVGLIRGRVTLLDQQKLGLPLTAYVVVRTNQHNDEWAGRFRSVIDSIPQVMEVYRMSGDLDYLIKVVIRDMPDYDRIYKQIIKADLYDVSCSFVMETMKLTSELPLDCV